MGGCASKPKDFDTKEAPAPVEAPVPDTTEKAEADADAVPQENKDGDEIKKEEPLVDLSEPAPEAAKNETEEAAPGEEKKADAVEEPPKEEKKEVAETEKTAPKS